MKKAPRRYAVAGTVNPRHGYHWSRIKGFSDWFIRIASQRTNHELAGEILAVWKQTASRAAIDSLRRQFDAHMTPETRRRAYEKRNNTATVGEQDAEAKTLMESRAAHRRTLSKLEEARVTKKELVDAVYAAAKDAASSLAIAPVRKPTPPKSARDREGETALIVVSDQQLGKRTPTYSSEICEERMARYMDKVELLTQIQRSYHPVRKARVYLLGDIIEGEMIFPGQAHRIDSSLYRQVVVDGPRIISDVIRRALGLFDEVHVVGVIGNHGAIGGPSRREYHPESNGDLMLYRVVQTIFEQSKQDRLTFDIPYLRGERSWYSVDVVGDHKFFLFHGDHLINVHRATKTEKDKIANEVQKKVSR